MENFYIIRPDGKLCHAPLRVVSDGADILRSLARSEPIIYRNYPAPGYTFKAAPDSVVLAKKLDRIKLNTWFAPITLPDGTARITPVFYDNGMAIHQNLEFTPPEGHEFWFFCPFDMMRDQRRMSDAPHMAWLIRGDNIYRPPFSNTYDDGRICMGRNWSEALMFARSPTGTLLEQFEAAEDWFQNAESNTDLRPHIPPIPLLLWDPTTMAIDYRGWDNIDTSMLRSLSGWVYDRILTP